VARADGDAGTSSNDGKLLGGTYLDRFRIKIWKYDENLKQDVIVHDNGPYGEARMSSAPQLPFPFGTCGEMSPIRAAGFPASGCQGIR
jgi:hypothetical protein